MSFLSDTLGFEGFHLKRIAKQLMDDPSRLVTGVDPLSTGVWNTILGTHKHAIVDQMGGATGEDYKAAEAAGINTTAGHDMQDLAHVIAAAYAVGGLAGAGGADGASIDPALAGDNIDAGGGWSPASNGSPALAGDNIDAGGGWSPASRSPASNGSGGFDYQKMLGKALGQMGQSKQQAAAGGSTHPVNVQPGNVPWNFMQGGGGY